MELVTRLLRPEERAAAALALAARLGGKALLLFVRDPEIGALLPAPGFPQTLAGGRAWHSFLDLCLETGSQTGALRLKADADPLPAIGFPVAGDAVLVLLGATAVSEEVPGALLLLPILVAALRAEHLAATAATEARGALEAAERAAAVTGTLTAARSALQEALHLAEAARAELAAANNQLQAQAAELETANDHLQEQAAELEIQTEELQSTTEELLQQGEAREAAGRAVAAREARYRALVQATAQIVWTTDASGQFVSEQPDWAAFTGQTFDQYQGWGWLEAIHPDDHPHTAAAWHQAVTTRTICEVEYRLLRHDGVHRTFAVRAAPVFDEAGELREWVGSETDMTDQRAAERGLLEQERQFRTLAETIPQLAWMAEPNGYIFWYNQRWYDYSGTTPEEMAGWGWQAVHDPRELPRVLDSWQASIRTGEPFEFEFPLRGADGRFRWFLTRSLPIKDADGQVVRWFGTNTNIDEQRAAAAALQERKERLEAALFASGTGTFRWDIQTNALDWDESLDRLFGLAPGKTTRALEQFLALVHPEDRARVIAACGRCASEGVEFDEEFRVVWPDGSVHWLDDKGKTVLGNDGTPLYMTGACVDITARVRSEQQLRQAQKLQAVATLAGGVAHEVNNQMTAVLGFGQFALRALPAGHPQGADLREMVKAAERAAKVTQQLLTFSRQQVTRPRLLDLSPVVEGLSPVLTQLLGSDKSLLIMTRGLQRLVNADPTQIEQVLINLAANARDAMPTGGRLTITLDDVTLDRSYAEAHGGVQLNSGRYVLLAASDTGTGMNRETLAQIFEPFFTTKPVGQGTGLGLSMVYGIVKQHGGFVWAYSEPELGTTVKVYLPAAAGPETDESLADSSTAAHAALPEPGRSLILVVEDEPTVRGLVRRALESAGYAVMEAGNGREALTLVTELGALPELVVTDVIMPELTGRELGDMLNRAGTNLPILYISGYTGDDVVLRGLIPKGAPFLQKPFAPDVLVRRVEEQLAQSRALDRA